MPSFPESHCFPTYVSYLKWNNSKWNFSAGRAKDESQKSLPCTNISTRWFHGGLRWVMKVPWPCKLCSNHHLYLFLCLFLLVNQKWRCYLDERKHVWDKTASQITLNYYSLFHISPYHQFATLVFFNAIYYLLLLSDVLGFNYKNRYAHQAAKSTETPAQLWSVITYLECYSWMYRPYTRQYVPLNYLEFTNYRWAP